MTERHMQDFPFGEVQANIFKGHGRYHAWHLFICFRPECQIGIKSWLHDHVLPLITSAQQQLDMIRRHREDPGYDGGMVGCLALSASAYAKLGIPEKEWPEDQEFRAGMKSRGPILNDPEVMLWEAGYQNDLDAVLILADNEPDKLQETANQLKASLERSGSGSICRTEIGTVLEPGGPCREHFGFVDSISQPDFWDAYGRFHETAWKLALVRDQQSPHLYGSYLVFRKLEQNVKRFRDQVRSIAGQIIAPNALELAEAQTMGRFRNGLPLTLCSGSLPNDFKYLENTDLHGSKCPFHAHMRKANPRNKGYKAKQLTRRGIPYGTRKPDLSDEPETGVGLLFISYQVAISNFEEVQIQCNDPGPGPHSTLDPIIGQPVPGTTLKPQAWNKKWHDPAAFPYTFQPVVQLKGGEYFFQPPLTYLKEL
ncbi:MAG: Dyp-type peroxidase [Saprospiraceae bacterium]